MNDLNVVNGLTEEYLTMLRNPFRKSSGQSYFDNRRIEELLVSEGEWSPKAAEHLCNLATSYGSFMLRNALALSLALQIEDGDLGF